MRPGVRAVLGNLSNNPDLNGKEVKLEEWKSSTGRWKCSDNSGQIFNIQPRHLTPMKEEAAAPIAKRPRVSAGSEAEGPARQSRTLDQMFRAYAAGKPAANGQHTGKSAVNGASPAASPQRRRLSKKGSPSLAASCSPASRGHTVTPPTRSPPPKKVAKTSASEPPAGAAMAQRREGRTVEEIYKKKTQLEHVLLRPDSYVGSIERQTQHFYVHDAESGKMVSRQLEYVPALYKIYDEILVNAADNLVRDPTMDTIRIKIDTKKSQISVWNNGQGLPVEMHKEHKCYVPDLVFGQLLTSDNYDDSEKKVVGGRNGYGAKLTNIFSRRFTVETADSTRQKLYRQTWEQNMTKRGEPTITNSKSSSSDQDFTSVTFEPDLTRFGMKRLEDDIVQLMRRRAFDIAASTRGRCKVYLDGELLEVSSFEDYVGMFLEADVFRICESCNDRWEIAVALTDGSGFQHVSMVNSINTFRGGTHVNYIGDQVIHVLMEQVSKQKRNRPLTIKPQHLRGYLWIFVNCLIENPAFDSQTKDTLTSKKDRFGSTCTLSKATLDAVMKSGVLEAVTAWSEEFGKSELARHLNKSDLGQQKRLYGIPKLEDANKAGTKQSEECTLIITEGDSAKALAVAGLSVVGRDYYGVFPLRGKLRNVRDLTVKQMMENKEIEQLVQIMALDASKNYQDTKGLRYGSLTIMADQDFDGSHIKGLVINFVQKWFPGLLRVPGFLREFITPIVKAKRGDDVITFFTIPEFEAWKRENSDGAGWTCKYYKGLGTSTSVEAREYFSDLDNHQLSFTHSNTDQDDNLIDMAFNGKRADDRKDWIQSCEEGTYVDHNNETVSYDDFVNKELVLFAKYDVERMIPSMVDGFKPGQRKVLFGAFKKKLTSDIKVAQLSGYVAEKSAYHHGETSLQGTIVGMAQTFVGSNNINLLLPSGQFGTRGQGGKDHAAARYIFTRLSPVTRTLFPQEDDPVLEYLSEEGMGIEPRWYCPVIPTILVNGADGIGVGWSTSVPNYNPRDLIANIRHHIRGEPLKPLSPWYRGFRGSITAIAGEKKYESLGLATRRGHARVEITELPVRRWTQDYKEWLLEQMPTTESDARRSMINDFREYHTDNKVHFSVSMDPDKLAQAEAKGLEKAFHLRHPISTSNMYLFDAKGKLKKYESPEEVLIDFAQVRLEIYGRRKEHHLARIGREVAELSDKARFVRFVVDEKLEVGKRATAKVCADMRALGLRTKREIEMANAEDNVYGGCESPRQFKRLRSVGSPRQSPRIGPSSTSGTVGGAAQTGADTVENDAGPKGYGYLLRMKLWTLTHERLAELEAQVLERRAAWDKLKQTTLEQMWEQDLQGLEQAIDAWEAADLKEEEEAEKLSKASKPVNDCEEDGNANQQCVLVLSKNFSEIKRVRTDQWRATKRGGRGTGIVRKARISCRGRGGRGKGAAKGGEDGEAEGPDEAEGEEAKAEDAGAGEEEDAAGEGDAISGLFACRQFDALLAFTEDGRVHAMQALDVPLKKRSAMGMDIRELLPSLEANHRIVAVVPVPQGRLKDQDSEFVVIVTALGMGKRIPLSALRGLKPGKPSVTFSLEDGDEVRWVHRASSGDHLVVVSDEAMATCFSLVDLRAVNSLRGKGTAVIKLADGCKVGSCVVAHTSGGDLVAGTVQAAAPTKKQKVRPTSLFMSEKKLSLKDGHLAWAKLSPVEKQPYVDQADALNAKLGQDRRGKAKVDDDDDTPVSSVAATALQSQSIDTQVAEGGDEPMDDASEADDGDCGEEADADRQTESAMDAAAEGPSTGAKSAAASGLSVLLVTRLGIGKRVRISDIGIKRRNIRGIKSFRLTGRDSITGACVVPDDEVPKEPKAPREPLALFLEEREQERREKLLRDFAEASKQTCVAEPPAACGALVDDGMLAQGEAAPSAVSLAEAAAAQFSALSAAEKAPYVERSTREAAEYQSLVDARRQQEQILAGKLGEVLICTAKGFTKRVQVSSVPVLKRSSAGMTLIKVDKSDAVLTASHISSEDGEEGEPVACETAVGKRPAEEEMAVQEPAAAG